MSPKPNVLKQYIKQIKKNVQQAIRIENLAAKSALCFLGNWVFQIHQENDTISENITVTIRKKDVPVLAPQDAIKNKVVMLAREIILNKDKNFKSSQKTKFEYYASLDEDDKKEFNNKVSQYITAHATELEFEATKQLLIANGVMPKIINRALQESARTAQKRHVLNRSPISVKEDEGYCAKSLFIPLYELKCCYGGFEWLPKVAETVTHPFKMVRYLRSKKKDYLSEGKVPLNATITSYEAGTIVMVDQGGKHMHAMMYNGINKITGRPQYIGFNSNDYNRVLNNSRVGIIVNIPQMINDDIKSGHIKSQNQTRQALHEIKRPQINIPEQPVALSLKLLSRGQKAECVRLQIERKFKDKVR